MTADTNLILMQVLFVAFDKAWILGAVLCKLLLYGQIVTLATFDFTLYLDLDLDLYFDLLTYILTNILT